MTARERTPRVLAAGLAFGEGPRWRAGRLWLSDMHDFQVVTVDLAGRLERVLRVQTARVEVAQVDVPGAGWP